MDSLEDILEKLKGFEGSLNNEDYSDEEFLKFIQQTLGDNGGTKLQVGITLLNENSVVPKYGKVGDAGADYTITSIKDESEDEITYGFGVAVEIPRGYVGLLFPRSSIRNTNLSLKNGVGVIDSCYRGEVMATFRKHHKDTTKVPYKVNERGAQMIIIPFPDVEYIIKDKLSETDRGEGGFGSTN